MAKLEEYLGTLVSNLSQARVLADLESARIAEVYAANNLLKHFSIPRMKIQDVELTIPLAIEGTVTEMTRNIKPLSPAKFTTLAYREVLTALGTRSLPAEVSTSLKNVITSDVKGLEARLKWDSAEKALGDFAQLVSKNTGKIIDPLIKAKKLKIQSEADRDIALKALEAALVQKLKSEIQFMPDSERLKHLDVTVETDKLKAKNPESLVIVKMKISEENMEWVTMEDSDGNIVHKLMPY